MASFDYDVVIIGSGVRRKRRRAPCGGEGLPGRRHGVRAGAGRTRRSRRAEWDLPQFIWFPAAELYGIQRIEYLDDVLDALRGRRRRRFAHLREHAVRAAEAVLRRSRVGRTSPIGPTSSRPTSTRPGGCSGVVRYPYMPTDMDRAHAKGRNRHRARGDVQQGSGRGLLREPGCRGRGPVLRRRRAAAHRLHLLRQLQHRLWPQRQEQADDELPVPGGEAWREVHELQEVHDLASARRRRIRGARAPSRLGAACRARRTITPTPPSRSSSPPTRTARRSCCTTCSTRAA